MNRTAVIITGQPRTFAHCWKTQREAVFRKLDDPHFFISFARSPTQEADETDGALCALARQYPGRVHWENVEQPAMPEELRARFEAESFHAPWYRSVPVEAIWKQFWHLGRGWEMFNEIIGKDDWPASFTRFVRIRPDLHFHNWTKPREVLRGETTDEKMTRWLLDPMPSEQFRTANGVYAPWWGSWGGCPDRFAYIVGGDAACAYFNVFNHIKHLLNLGCAYHPETMLARALELAGVPVHQTMDAEFMTIRVKGDSRPHDKASYSNRDILNYINARTQNSQ